MDFGPYPVIDQRTLPDGSIEATIEVPADVVAVLRPPMHVGGSISDQPIVLTKVKNGLITIRCPGCMGFDYERTRVSVARSWAAEHNEKKHNGLYKVVDLTVNTKLEGKLAT